MDFDEYESGPFLFLLSDYELMHTAWHGRIMDAGQFVKAVAMIDFLASRFQLLLVQEFAIYPTWPEWPEDIMPLDSSPMRCNAKSVITNSWE